MWKLLQPPAYKPEMEADKVDAKYKRMRLQVFLGIFIGYAGFYIVRKNFSMAIPELTLLGFDQSELSIVLSMNAVAYALSKFLMEASRTAATPACSCRWDWSWQPCR